MTPAEILCWRYSYVELMWELILSRNAKMKRETDLGLRKTLSRRGKPIKTFEKRLSAAGNGEKRSKNAFPRREMGKILRKTVSRGGKASKSFGDRFRATGRRLKVSEIGFVRREKEDNLEKCLSAAE